MENEQVHTGEVRHIMPSDRERVLGAISYIGPLFVVSYLMMEQSKFVKFHATQGLVYFLAAMAVKFVVGAIMMAVLIPSAVVSQRYGFMGMMYGGVGGAGLLSSVVSIAILVVGIMGVVKAARGIEWEMPIIGAWAKKMQM